MCWRATTSWGAAHDLTSSFLDLLDLVSPSPNRLFSLFCLHNGRSWLAAPSGCIQKLIAAHYCCEQLLTPVQKCTMELPVAIIVPFQMSPSKSCSNLLCKRMSMPPLLRLRSKEACISLFTGAIANGNSLRVQSIPFKIHYAGEPQPHGGQPDLISSFMHLLVLASPLPNRLFSLFCLHNGQGSWLAGCSSNWVYQKDD